MTWFSKYIQNKLIFKFSVDLYLMLRLWFYAQFTVSHCIGHYFGIYDVNILYNQHFSDNFAEVINLQEIFCTQTLKTSTSIKISLFWENRGCGSQIGPLILAGDTPNTYQLIVLNKCMDENILYVYGQRN